MPDPHEPTSRPIDINADLNAQDDDGYGWSTLSRAIRPAVMVLWLGVRDLLADMYGVRAIDPARHRQSFR